MRTGTDKASHENLLKHAARHLKQKNFEHLKVDHLPGYSEPSEIKGHIPDITAKGGGWIIVEAETDKSLNESHSDSQLKSFGSFAHENGHTFWLLVPKVSKQKAEATLRRLGLTSAKVWTA